MERRASQAGASSYMDKAGRSSISGTSSVTNRPSHMKSSKVSTQRRAVNEKTEHPITVTDPEDKSIDRTPHSLLRQAAPQRIPKKGGKVDDSSTAVSNMMSPSMTSLNEEKSTEKASTSRMESSDDEASESSRMESWSGSDDEESVAGMDRLALDDVAETSSVDSRLPEEKKKKRDKGDGEPSDDAAAKGGREGGRKRHAQEESALQKKKEMDWQAKKEWREAVCSVTLSETPTMFLLEKPDEMLGPEKDKPDATQALMTQRFQRYHTFCQNSKGNDRFAERGMLTFNNPSKNKETQKSMPATSNQRSGVTVWDIHDTMQQLEEEEGQDDVVGIGTAEGQEGGENGDGVDGVDDDETNAMMQEMDEDDDEPAARDKHHRKKVWMNHSSIIERLTVVERVVVSNIWHVEQLLYRNIQLDSDPTYEEDLDTKKEAAKESPKAKPDFYGVAGGKEDDREEKKEKEREKENAKDTSLGPESDLLNSQARLRMLWRFGCDMTRDKNVSCQSWNKGNPDLLAVGYGEYGIPGTDSAKGKSSDGMVCCWSVKNPVHPERVFHIHNAGVSSVDFSHHHPSLLAVGNTDGTLALYDVRKQSNTPALKSTVQGGQHTGTIWEVKWVDKGRERNNDLVSISADGLVKQWTFKKGLECQCTLMKLKRTQNESQGNAFATQQQGSKDKGEALLSRQSGGMCLDFNPSEPITYVVGTEDGTLHKCNTSNQENPSQDYSGHNDPVYRVRWHPFCSDYFMSCSADWTAKLWHEKKTEPVIAFDSRQDAIHDVVWSPVNACVFATVTSTGRLDVWNTAEPLEPQGSMQLDDRSINTALFAQQESPVITLGDNKGDVTVIKLKGSEFERPARSNEEQSEYFSQVVKKNTQ